MWPKRSRSSGRCDLKKQAQVEDVAWKKQIKWKMWPQRHGSNVGRLPKETKCSNCQENHAAFSKSCDL